MNDKNDSISSIDTKEESNEELHHNGDWNKRFQSINNTIKKFDENTPLNEQAEAYVRLIGLARDFNFTSEMYGKIIISEVYLPTKEKTIKPIQVGGL